MFNDINASTLDRSNYMNREISKRNIPSNNLQPYLNTKSISTKFIVMPTYNLRKEITTVDMKREPLFSIENTFNPGTRKAPNWEQHVNTESELRNQIFALQKGEQHVYVPDSFSSLYYHTFTNSTSSNLKQPHEQLFKEQSFTQFNPNPHNLGYQLFNNSTRHQLKEISKNPLGV